MNKYMLNSKLVSNQLRPSFGKVDLKNEIIFRWYALDRILLVCFVLWFLTMPLMGFGQEQFSVPERWDYAYEAHPALELNQNMPEGPFVRIGPKSIVSAWSPSGQDVLLSNDNGDTWKKSRIFSDTSQFKINAKAIQQTKDGVIVLAFTNIKEANWTWSDELKDAPGAVLPTYVTRSMDNGNTWTKPVKLHDDWTGHIAKMIVTRDNHIVFTSMMMRHNPGRHTVLTYMSADNGETWTRSNVIDLGGSGHHGGVTEPTLVELKDGSLRMLIRTNWMEFWDAQSLDGGRTWHPLGPSRIPASPSHGQLQRLSSGRIVLVWNRPFPEGSNSYPMVGGDQVWSAVPVSNFRGELSMAFSDDEGKSWSTPTVIASTKTLGFRKATAGGAGKYMPQREISYPHVFEYEPGVLWITTARGPLRAIVKEKDFAK
ncbi:sialidase family protein [Membranihabitans marinus]|uniref:sialidase family protein n=1 Tax=Membranihabitans marinus TaxID=1227546 RepID=UPI001F226D5B|nr:sialidase family protein [Membranihabitans marinus]